MAVGYGPVRSLRHFLQCQCAWRGNCYQRRTRMSSVRVLSVVIALVLGHSSGFNLAPKYARVLSDPSMQRHSYFGYSVAVRRQSHKNGSVPWMVIGAPRGDSPYLGHSKLVRPGVVYLCAVSGPKFCEQLVLDTEGSNTFSYTNYKVRGNKNNSDLGSSLDVQDSGDGVVVCAPRWKNNYHQDIYHLNGICYWANNTQNPEKKVKKFYPLINESKQVQKDTEEWYYGLGEAGLSVRVIKDGKEIIMGAPGFMEWRGAILRYTYKEEYNDFGSYIDVASGNNIKLPVSSYLGYSLSAIKVGKRLLYVSGAPRAAGLKGKVILLDFVNEKKAENGVVREWVGQTMGEYFGAALCVVDLNGDEREDLVVGAPLYSEKTTGVSRSAGDEGCIYIFISDPQIEWRKLELVKGSGTRGARFGTAISALGDLNWDGYNDIAVGAPYEDENAGAVYIYLGRRDGMNLKYSQRLSAREINPYLRGFGASISRGLDVDDNNYRDVAIGAYLSNHAVLVKSYPVAIINPRLSANVNKIGINDTEFEVTACVLYSGKHVPRAIDLKLTVEADPVYNRAHFLIGGEALSIYKFNANYQHGLEKCRNWTVIIKNYREYTNPIGFTLDYDLLVKASILQSRHKRQIIEDYSENFCKDCPVLDPSHSKSISWELPFATGCQTDSVCKTDIVLSADFIDIDSPYVIGSSDSINIRVVVENNLETAFQTRISILVPSATPLKRMPPTCQENTTEEEVTDTLQLLCDVDSPLRWGSEAALDLVLDMSKLPPDLSILMINITADSAGEEQNDTDNGVLLTLLLQAEVDVTISGGTTQNQIVYINGRGKDQEDKMFTHTYQVFNHGPSPVQSFVLEFKIPIKVRANGIVTEALQVYEPEAYLEQQPFTCKSEPGFYTHNTRHFTESTNAIDEMQITRRKRSVSDQQEELPFNRTLKLDCSRSNIDCMSVYCSVGPLSADGRGAKVIFRMKIKLQQLGPVLGKRDILLVKTTGQVTLGNETISVSTSADMDHESTVQTILYAKVNNEVDSWLLAISIAGGILILLFSILCLVKIGFFKRQKQMELQELKQKFPTQHIFIFETNGSLKNKC